MGGEGGGEEFNLNGKGGGDAVKPFYVILVLVVTKRLFQ